MPRTELEAGLGGPQAWINHAIAPVAPEVLTSKSKVADAALEILRTQGWAYAKREAPTSPYPNLSGNLTPGVTRLTWLRGQNKCNQFVGDALIMAGFKMPTYRMPNGSEHYMMAEALPEQNCYFDRLGRLDTVRAGDLLVLDYGQKRGASGAHTEIIIGYDSNSKAFKVVGAHQSGAGLSDFRFVPGEWLYNGTQKCWLKGGNCLYYLRPKSGCLKKGHPCASLP